MDNTPTHPPTNLEQHPPPPLLSPTSSSIRPSNSSLPSPVCEPIRTTAQQLPGTLPPANPASFGASPPLPPLPPQDRPLSLSKSLAQLQGEAAFVARPPPPPAAPPAIPIVLEGDDQVPKKADDDDAEFYVSGLTARELFVRLPEFDPVSQLLEKYLQPQHRPQRDLSGNWEGETLDTLIASRNWRGTARYSYNAITQCPPERTAYLLSHWLLRLHSLLRLRLIPQLAAELTSILSLLPPSSCLASIPLAPGTPRFHPAVPFDYHVLAASLPSLQGNKHQSIEALSALVRSSKEELWAAKRAGRAQEERMWRERVERIGEMLVELLTAVKASSSASTLTPSTPSSSLYRHLSHLHFSTGNLAALSRHALAAVEDRDRREADVLSKVAQGQWKEAESELRRMLSECPGDVETINDLAVVLLYAGKLNEAIALLTSLVSSNPSRAYHDETLLFNLATLHELRTEKAMVAKIDLLKGAADAGAQGVDATAFKLVL